MQYTPYKEVLYTYRVTDLPSYDELNREYNDVTDTYPNVLFYTSYALLDKYASAYGHIHEPYIVVVNYRTPFAYNYKVIGRQDNRTYWHPPTFRKNTKSPRYAKIKFNRLD